MTFNLNLFTFVGLVALGTIIGNWVCVMISNIADMITTKWGDDESYI